MSWYSGRGRWAQGAFAVRVYLTPSPVAEIALAGQVYAGS